jgi:hypothetical protein
MSFRVKSWRRPERPTGIVRTLPSLDGDASIGARRYQSSIALMETGRLDAIYIALQSIPKFDVVHIYLIVDGAVDVRLNIAGYEPGDSRECWDRTIRKPKVWAVCTGPVVRPPERLERKGFQGFRYTNEEELF